MNNNINNKNNNKTKNNDKKSNSNGVVKLSKTNSSLKNEERIIWNKIMLFSIIFLPYALYLFLFKTKVSKYIKAIVVIILSIALFFIYDTVQITQEKGWWLLCLGSGLTPRVIPLTKRT